MGYKRVSWLQQVLYVMVHKLGKFERNRWQFILYGKLAEPKDNTDS